MLASKGLWLGFTALYYMVLIVLQLRYPGLFSDKGVPAWFRSLNWVYALVYSGLGIVLQGAITRTFSALSANFWRPVMLCLGAALALLNAVIFKWWTDSPMNIDLWLSAVLGLALVATLARVLPQAILLRWYGVQL